LATSSKRSLAASESACRLRGTRPDEQVADPAPSPERRVIAFEEMEAIKRLFEGDWRAQQILDALYEGWTPDETRARYGLSKTDYDSTRKRMRRALIRVGLRTLSS